MLFRLPAMGDYRFKPSSSECIPTYFGTQASFQDLRRKIALLTGIGCVVVPEAHNLTTIYQLISCSLREHTRQIQIKTLALIKPISTTKIRSRVNGTCRWHVSNRTSANFRCGHGTRDFLHDSTAPAFRQHRTGRV